MGTFPARVKPRFIWDVVCTQISNLYRRNGKVMSLDFDREIEFHFQGLKSDQGRNHRHDLWAGTEILHRFEV
eukprot:750436-Hanusia_phi.AAC.1